MSIQTETFVVADGTTMLDGQSVKAGQRVKLLPSAALYHLSLGRIQRTKTVRKTASVGKSTDALLHIDEQPESGASD